MRTQIICHLFFALIFFGTTQGQTPVGNFGKLKLVGLQLSSECGDPVQLRGISTHGPQWFENCYSSSSVEAIANNWNADVFRLALYVEEDGYVLNPAKWKLWVDKMVETAEKLGIYCLIDWHVLADGDPMKNIEAAKDFWDYVSKKHGGKKNVLYEICNEPNERYKYYGAANEKFVNWARIKQYAEIIIPIIRKNDPETIIIVGTPFWSNRPWKAAADPLTGANAYNTMYTYHYYASTPQHNKNLDTVKTILNKIPIFASEWGLSEESGDGNVDLASAQNFADVLGGKNDAQIKVSWCTWSFADKDESSALLKPFSCANATWNNRTTAGNKTYALINIPAKNASTCFPEPVIVQHPQNVVNALGDSTALTVQVSGDQLQYLWQKSINGNDWMDLPNSNSKKYAIASISNSDFAFYRVMVSNYIGILYSQKASIIKKTDGAYFGTPTNIPGKIEAENYDTGGQNKSYFDNSSGNTGGKYRNDDVDISSTSDSLGGFSIGYWGKDEWLDFTIDVLSTASYDFYFRVGSAIDNTKFKIQIDGTTIIPTVAIPNLNSWSAYSTVSVKGINLSKGIKKLRVYALSDGFNLNYIEINGPNIDCNLDLNGTASIDKCGICSGGNTGIVAKTLSDKCYEVVTQIEKIQAQAVLIYPNPFQNHFFVSTESPAAIELLDVNSRVIMENKLLSSADVFLPDALPSGIYHLRVITKDGVSIHKVVKN
ncbi:MAG: cellulase family glycosylhydrolase [Bacteroidetes bacterium]|nr:cellulase family glycosylhydrolase [Bacteroidota bacterium]